MLKEWPIYNFWKYKKVKGKQVRIIISEEGYKDLDEGSQKEIEKLLLVIGGTEDRLKNIKANMVKLSQFLEKPLTNEITLDDIIGVNNAVKKANFKKHTRNEVFGFIRRFLRYRYPDWEARFRIKDLKLLRAEDPKNTDLTPDMLLTAEDIKSMLKASVNLRDKAIIEALTNLGCRPEELLKLKPSDFDFKKDVVKLYSSKTKRFRFVPFQGTLNHVKLLIKESDLKEDDYIFSPYPKKKISNSNLNMKIRDIAKRSGIKKRVWGYLFRHTRLSFLITRLSPKVYEIVAGHSLETGMRTYSHLTPDEVRDEMIKKVFSTEELTSDQRNELETLKKRFEDFQKEMIMINLDSVNNMLKQKGLTQKEKEKALELKGRFEKLIK